MKTKYGYRASECRRNGEYRHLNIYLYAIRPFDVATALRVAIERGDQYHIAAYTKLVKAAAGRTVYIQDSEASVSYQAEQSIEYWYGASLSMTTFGQGTMRRAAFKAFDKSEWALTPKQLIESLGAIRLDSLRDEHNESIRAGCEYAKVESTESDDLLNDPYPKAKEVA